jgi:hypothetical protein
MSTSRRFFSVPVRVSQVWLQFRWVLMFPCVAAVVLVPAFGGLHTSWAGAIGHVQSASGLSIAVQPNGDYSVSSASPSAVFSGSAVKHVMCQQSLLAHPPFLSKFPPWPEAAAVTI